MPRPPEPGFTPHQAARFRKAFRSWCLFYNARNEDAGEALDHNRRLCGAWGEDRGTKEVANAMLAARRLTHRVARRLFVGLLLSKPARGYWDRLNPKPMLEPVCQEGYALLSQLRAVSFERPVAVPAFVPLEAVDELARALVTNLRVKGIGASSRDQLREAIARHLRDEGGSMARAWCDWVMMRHDQPVGRRRRESHLKRFVRDRGELQRVLEKIAEVGLDPHYVSPEQGAVMFPELAELHRSRPELKMSVPRTKRGSVTEI